MDRIIDVVRDSQDLSLEDVRWAIEHAGRVDQLSFKVWSILLMGCAILASTARLVVRYLRERTFPLEEYFILFATICFITETALAYSVIPSMYLIDAATLQLPVLRHIILSVKDSPAYELQRALFDTNTKTLNASFVLGWLVIFSVKASVLSLFHGLLRDANKLLVIWYRITVAFTASSALIAMIEAFALCTQFGAGPMRCFIDDGHTVSIQSGMVAQLLDIATNFMVISIPALMIHMSKSHLQLRLRLIFVVCLSAACIVTGITRIAGGLYSNVFRNRQFSVVWLTFMLHCEAAATLMAGSVSFTTQQSITGKRIILSRSDNVFPITDDSTFNEETVAKTEASDPVHGGDKALAINKWRHSVVNIIPRRTGSNRSRRLLGVHQRNESTESAILHPVLAYHKFRRQERDEEASRDAFKDMKAIKITYDMTISSQSAPDGLEDANDVDTIRLVPQSPTCHVDISAPEPAMTTRRMDYFVQGQFGKIQTGMQM